MGRLDAFDVATKKLTVQTEFFERPQPRIETKVYLGGALKKLYSLDLPGADEGGWQKAIDEFHKARLTEIEEGLRARKG